MPTIDATSNNDPDPARQSNDGLGQPNPSPTDEIVRRGQEALQRLRRSFGDWLAIAEALQVGRAEIMSAVPPASATRRRWPSGCSPAGSI